MGQADRSRRAAWVQTLWHLSDLAAIFAGFGLGYWVRFSSPLSRWIPPEKGIPPVSWYLLGAGVTALVWIPLQHFFGLYRMERGRPRHRGGEILRAQGFGMLAVAALSFFYRDITFSRVAVPLIWLCTFGFTLLGRRLVQWLVRSLHVLVPIRFAVVGTGAVAQRLARILPQSPYPHALVGCLRTGTDASHALPAAGLADLGASADLAARGAELDLDLLVLAEPPRSGAELNELFALCQRFDWDLLFVPELLSVWSRRVRIEEIDGLPVLRLREPALTGWGRALKRTMDLVVSLLLLLLFSPLFALLAAAVKLSSPGPVFHRQERVGRDRRVFRIVKFRSMRLDAEAKSGPVWATKSDPRRTPVGTFLRRWSLDELPQLWNVLKGEMSLVGPRPERPFFVNQFEQGVADYYDRHRVKSGITGWAQVHGLRGDTPIEERTGYDLYYVENWSLGLDLRILALTALAVFRHPGE